MSNQNTFKLISRILISFGVLLINLFIFTFLGYWICETLYDVDITAFLASHSAAPKTNEMAAVRLFFSVYSVGTFILTAFVLAFVFKQKPLKYLKLDHFPKPIFLVVIPVLFIVFIPFISWLIQLNSQLVLPEFLSGIEQKLKTLENDNNKIYELLLGMNSYSDLFINILVMALIPAIGEELFCRGVLLNIFYEYSGKFFKSVVIVALIFTLLHLQFYKFLPMMSLAILIGLFINWTQSIWASILFHFLNNAMAVFAQFYFQRGVKNLLTDDSIPIPIILTFLSFLLTIALLVWLNKFSKQNTVLKNE